MKPRYFWLLSDHKTVREIDWEEWRKIAQQDFQRKGNTRLIARVHDIEVYIRKGNQFIWVPRVQLEKALKE